MRCYFKREKQHDDANILAAYARRERETERERKRENKF